jgi:hypothetical protein
MKTTPKETVTESRMSGVMRFITGLLLGGALLALVIFWLSDRLESDDLVLAGRFGHAVHFRGLAAWLLSGAIICFTAYIICKLIIPKHQALRRSLSYAAWALFLIGLVVGICNR